MRKKLLISALVLGGVAGVVLVRRRSSSGDGYDDDEIDAAGQGDTFGNRQGNAPEQKWAPAETRHDMTAEQLSTAARVEASFESIRTVWPTLTLDEVRRAEGDLDRLAGLIAEKVEQPRDQVRRRLDGIIAQETPRSSYPPH